MTFVVFATRLNATRKTNGAAQMPTTPSPRAAPHLIQSDRCRLAPPAVKHCMTRHEIMAFRRLSTWTWQHVIRRPEGPTRNSRQYCFAPKPPTRSGAVVSPPPPQAHTPSERVCDRTSRADKSMRFRVYFTVPSHEQHQQQPGFPFPPSSAAAGGSRTVHPPLSS